MALKCCQMETFQEWLETELNRRDWRIADLARRASVDKGNLSRVLSGLRNPGPDICLAIARALNVPPEDVFRQAGILPPKAEVDAKSEEMLHLFQQLKAEDQERLLQTARAWIENSL